MEKKQAQEYIQEVLNSKFDQEKFENFMRNLVNNFEPKDNSYSGNLIPEAFRDHISYYKRIGKYTDPEGEQLDILIVQTRSVSKLDRARTALRNFVVRHLKNFEKQFALVAFYSKEDDGADWRLSLVKIDYEKQRSEQGRIKIKEELVPAKRFSFLVGEHEDSYTAQKQLLPLLTNTYSDPLVVMEQDGDGSIEGAFGIEKVTDEFFEQYKNLFESLIKNEEFKVSIQEVGLEPNRFTKKLLGQIVFLYFLQKKGWLGVPKDRKMGEGSKRFLQDRFVAIEAEGKNYFNDFLRYLFYAALAREHNDEGVKYYFKDLKCKVPFLNGGLFEAEYDWENASISIPNNLFRNSEKNKAGDKGTGILDVFDRYNFTIKEDEPLEKEVAVDPEMLGKVFENMLEITERKSKGAFYTPREIVHYMCQESLIHYLDNAINDYFASYQALDTGQTSLFGGSTDKKENLKLEMEHKDGIRIPKENLEEFIRNGHLVLENDEAALAAKQRIKQGEIKSTKQKQLLPETISRNAEQLDKALADIKICDPAIGSGAFPVGLLHEIVTARKVLVPHLSRHYINNLQIKSGIGDTDTMPSEYYFKRHAIQESIYGVDIDASAIDIARLRLWLSMIVEEEDYETIEALPNLDYKIVCGNSLIGFPENWESPSFDRVEDLKRQFFSETKPERKSDLKKEIEKEVQARLDSSKRVFGYQVDFDFKLFFSEVWHPKGGFDVVIGNPPYGAKLSMEEKKYFKQEFNDVHMRTPDTFNYFISKGFRLLKKGGVLSHIVPNNMLFQNEYEKTRKFLIKKNELHVAINLGDGVFNSATVPSCIFIASKESSKSRKSYKFTDLRDASKKNIDLNVKLSPEPIDILLKVPSHVFGISYQEYNVLNKIGSRSVTISELALEMASGISTGGDKIFRVSENQILELQLERELLKPVLVGGDIDQYYINDSNHYIIYSTKNSKTNQFPNIIEYLSNFEYKLSQKRETQKGLIPWWSLHWPRYPGLFKSPKIIMRQTADSIRATLDFDNYYTLDSILILQVKKEFNVSYRYVLAILNSSVNQFAYKKYSQEGGRTFAQVKSKNMRKLFIPLPDASNLKFFEVLVDFLLFLGKESRKSIMYDFFLNLVDAISMNIFFQAEMEVAKKQIIPHLGNLNGLSGIERKEQKLAIIQSEFERLYDPNHPVRNNLETLDSIEEVRIIKNALK